jgi:flavodoxin
MLRGLMLGGTLALSTVSAACSAPGPDARSRATSHGETPSSRRSRSPGGNASTSPDSPPQAGGAPRVLIAYFSRAGENYYYGDRVNLDVGNTEVLTGTLSRRLSELGVAHDVHRIGAEDPYPENYEETVARNVREQDSDARPGISGALDSIDAYDVVLLGSPIWNVRPPMIMHTFAESYDFTGKTVHPFTTHAMSGLGTAERDYATACAGATIDDGLAVQGEEVRRDGPRAVTDWLTSIGLT